MVDDPTVTPSTTTEPTVVPAVEGGTVLSAPAAPEPAAPVVATDLTLPEGVASEGLEDFLKIASDTEMTPKARAQALVDLYAAKAKGLAEAPLTAFKELNTKWADEIRNDPEIGGDRLAKETLPAVARVIDHFGGEKFRQALDLTGMGNHPEMARFLVKVARAHNEGSHVGGNPPNAVKAPPSAAAALYPNLVKTGA